MPKQTLGELMRKRHALDQKISALFDEENKKAGQHLLGKFFLCEESGLKDYTAVVSVKNGTVTHNTFYFRDSSKGANITLGVEDSYRCFSRHELKEISAAQYHEAWAKLLEELGGFIKPERIGQCQ